MWQQYGPDVTMIGVMFEDNGYSPPNQQDLQSWCNGNNLTHVMLADGQGTQMNYVAYYPTFVVIDQTMHIANDDMWPFNIPYIAGLL